MAGASLALLGSECGRQAAAGSAARALSSGHHHQRPFQRAMGEDSAAQHLALLRFDVGERGFAMGEARPSHIFGSLRNTGCAPG